MLELKDIKKSYIVGEERQIVLKGINVKFRKNEFTSILGTSGSGKTTLLNLIGGLDVYDSGDLIIDGVSTKNYKDRDWDTYRNHRVGFIFQSYNLIMHQSVLQNVEIALTLSGVSKGKRKKKAIEALTKVGLKDHIHKKPNQLSGGQMQRVAIARALVNDPEIILADEPTGALDSATSVQIMDLLKEIAGDKLVIMVTHNPDLAKKYSNRIIELKDGLIVNDSNPFDGKEEVESKKASRTSMSLFTALSLSFNNLLTKKGRTFLTAFAGSIGIIGISLIIALSNGVNNYAKSIERDSLSDYPIKIEKTSYDIFGTFATAFEEVKNKKSYGENELCSNDDVVKTSVISSDKGLIKRNNLKEFIQYVNNNEDFKNSSDSIEYGYDMELQVFTKDYIKVNPSPIKEDAIIFTEMEQNKNDYNIVAGKKPENYHEVMLIVDNERIVSDSLLYSLNIKDRNQLTEEFNKIRKDDKYRVEEKVYKYDDILNREFKVILNTDYYKEINGDFIDYSNDFEYLKDKINNGIDIKIVGVAVDESASGSTIGYMHDLKLKIINEVSKTTLYKQQINNKNINVLTQTEFDGLTDTYEELAKTLGIYELDDPSSISFYPKDYNAKQKLTNLINKYNEDNKSKGREDLVVSYSDLMKSLIGGVSKVVKIVSYVLIGFVAISLIVSSIMISIITYISVLERTKEIGILRAIGASKRDIARVFRAETIIEGAISGILGVGIACLLSVPVNLIVGKVAKISGIATLPIKSAIILILLSIVLNLIAGNRPAIIAARKDPVESLRSE